MKAAIIAKEVRAIVDAETSAIKETIRKGTMQPGRLRALRSLLASRAKVIAPYIVRSRKLLARLHHKATTHLLSFDEMKALLARRNGLMSNLRVWQNLDPRVDPSLAKLIAYSESMHAHHIIKNSLAKHSVFGPRLKALRKKLKGRLAEFAWDSGDAMPTMALWGDVHIMNQAKVAEKVASGLDELPPFDMRMVEVENFSKALDEAVNLAVAKKPPSLQAVIRAHIDTYWPTPAKPGAPTTPSLPIFQDLRFHNFGGRSLKELMNELLVAAKAVDHDFT